jgi:antitoxin CcdA
MKHEHIAKQKRQSVNLYLDRTVVEDAKALGVNLSRACDGALRAAIKVEREARWKAENAEAIQSFNDYVDKHGIPLSQYRQF